MRIFGYLLVFASILEAQELPPVPQRVRGGQPLFLQGLGLRDPFTGKAQKLWELEEQIELTTKEIELLRLQIEKAKLWKQYVELTGGQPPGNVTLPQAKTEKESSSRSTSVRRRTSPSHLTPSVLQVLAVIYGERTQKARVRAGGTSAWVQAGDRIGGWEIVAVEENGVVARYGGRTTFFPVKKP